MIRTLNELIALTEREARRFPDSADITLLRTPGCSETELVEIRQVLPGIPASYLEVAAHLTLPAISIGYLELTPGRRDSTPLLPRLISANSNAFPLWKSIDELQVYCVAEYPPHLICVSREGTAHPGEVVLLELSFPPEMGIYRVAPTFEHLLLGFGRMREKFLEGKFGDDAIHEVLDGLHEDFHFDDEQMASWADIVSNDLVDLD